MSKVGTMPPGDAKWAFVFLWLFTVAIYSRPEDIFLAITPLHLPFVLGILAGLALLCALLAGTARLTWPTELKIVLLLTGWYIAGVPFAYWRGGSFDLLIGTWSKTLVVFFLMTQTVVSLDRIRKVLWAIILSELAVSAFTIFEQGQASWRGKRLWGFNGGILEWNYIGIALAITIPYAAALWLTRRSLIRTSLLAATLVSMMSMLLLVASRGGFLNVTFSLALTGFLVLRGTSRGRLMFLGLIIIVMCATAAAPGVFWERLGTLWDTSGVPKDELAASAIGSTEDRALLVKRSIQYTLEHPIFGLGIGNFVSANGTKIGRPEAWIGTHNTFTQISSEAGIPGLVLFLTVLTVALRNMKRIRKAHSNGPNDEEMSLMARATTVSIWSIVFGAFFVHIAYDYYIFYVVAFGSSLNAIVRRSVENSPVEALEMALPSPEMRRFP